MASVESQEYADRRIPNLLRIPARWHGLSLEPLLERVELDGNRLEWLAPFHEHDPMLNRTPRLDWLVIGGESGPKSRPCNIEWISSLVSQGKEAGTAVFVKQLGSAPYKYGGSVMDLFFKDFIKLKQKKGGDPTEWPADLRVREWPEGL
jgi:protein gp37